MHPLNEAGTDKEIDRTNANGPTDATATDATALAVVRLVKGSTRLTTLVPGLFPEYQPNKGPRGQQSFQLLIPPIGTYQ